MTDRFYPVGLPADADSWKTTYEVMNEMRSFARCAYPPGTSIHLPGSRDMYGFSAPGPDREKLARPELHPTEEVDVPNPREHHARTRVQIDDDRETFAKHDVVDMLQTTGSGHMASAVMNKSLKSSDGCRSMRSGKSGMGRCRSLPSIAPAPMRTSMPPDFVHGLEDHHFSYFVPRNLQAEGRAKLNPHMMSKLHKANRISFPFSGEGTGFRSQCGLTEVFPQGSYLGVSTQYKDTFTRPPFFRLSPLRQDGNA